MFLLIKYINFTHIFSPLHATSFIVGENSPAMYSWRKIAYEAPPLRFSPNYLYLLRLIITIVFLVISPQIHEQ